MTRALLVVLALSAAAPALAQQDMSSGFPSQGDGPPSAPTADLMGSNQAPGWGSGRKRYFISGSFDLGFLYIRPRFSFGWGRPHAKWVGLDLNPIVSTTALGGYGGFRISHPYVDWRVGARYTVPFVRSYMEARGNDEDFDRGDLNREIEGESGTYLSLETELTLSFPVGGGNLFSETALTYVAGVPEDRFAYEDTIKVIVDPPWIWRQRVGYMARFGATDAVGLGLVAELVGIPKRDMLVFRAGLIMRVWVSPRVEIRGTWIPAIAGRDELGVRGGDFGLLGLRYRWSTGGVTGRQEGAPAVLPEFREGEEDPVN
ncbi:MAG: hypothetical protein CMN30_03845 [Sandaracinus sp.]|nr:hypothetical protein [Sandaracinus sp.]